MSSHKKMEAKDTSRDFENLINQMIPKRTFKPGNKDDSASATTSRHTIVYLLVMAFENPPILRSSSGSRNQQTNRQTDRLSPGH